VPAFRVVPENGPDNKNESLGRANAAKFLERLCPYHGLPQVISEAERHIFEADAERMREDTDKPVTVGGHRPRARAAPAGPFGPVGTTRGPREPIRPQGALRIEQGRLMIRCRIAFSWEPAGARVGGPRLFLQQILAQVLTVQRKQLNTGVQSWLNHSISRS